MEELSNSSEEIESQKNTDIQPSQTQGKMPNNTNKEKEDEIERTSKLLQGGDDFFLKVPKKIIEEADLKENDYVVVNLKKTKFFIIETDKETLEEVEKLKKLPQYAEKDSGEIIKDLMFKFNSQNNEKDPPKRSIALVEKGSLE